MMNSIKKIGFFLLCLAQIVTQSACNDDDDGEGGEILPKISIGSVTLFEGEIDQTYNFKVTTSEASELEIRVNYSTDEITATANVDFTDVNETLVIPAGERSIDVTIEVLGDTMKEADEEFKVILSNPVNATIAQAEGIGTIRNDDSFIVIPEDGYITPESYTGYDLVFQDEFEGTSINGGNWTHELGGHGWGNNELQNYTAREENSFISDGKLVIEAKEENYEGSSYTSARMVSLNKKSFTWGRIDIRAKLPEGQGIWPALWMLGTNISTVGWPACGEIDIMELVGHQPSSSHGTAHWGSQGQGFSHYKGGSYYLSGEKFSEKFHVFSILWEANKITWMVDDNEFFSLTPNDVNGNYPFNNDFFFIMNIAVGGNWPGSPNASTVFPQRMFVDYIRVFQ